MEATFMTIHNLTPDANILFASESITEILGYQPYEVQGRSCFDYFHPDEVPFAKNVHTRGVQLDKAASLHYARIKGKNGEWIGCECVFTVVYDVLVACTSIYKQDERSQKRAAEAPTIRRLFASSPRDPRYHMLEHLSAKFKTPVPQAEREPRAALILNRFSRTLTIMYATNSVANILGVGPDLLKDKSFYECIQENCQPGAIRCIESAKSNDSIAYLRFWYRDPRQPEEIEEDQRSGSPSSSDNDEDGGVELRGNMDVDVDGIHISRQPSSDGSSARQAHGFERIGNPHTSSGDTTSGSFSMSRAHQDDPSGTMQDAQTLAAPAQAIEIEAVISCTSDGLVVILRRARPQIPSDEVNNGLYAAPWGAAPIQPLQAYQPAVARDVQVPRHNVCTAGGPSSDSFMASIREIAVFAWSLTGINGNIANYGHGTPRGEAVPPTGFPVWDPLVQNTRDLSPENQAHQKWTQIYQNSVSSSQHTHNPFAHQVAPPPYERGYYNEDAHGGYFPPPLRQAYVLLDPQQPDQSADPSDQTSATHSNNVQQEPTQNAESHGRGFIWF